MIAETIDDTVPQRSMFGYDGSLQCSYHIYSTTFEDHKSTCEIVHVQPFAASNAFSMLAKPSVQCITRIGSIYPTLTPTRWNSLPHINRNIIVPSVDFIAVFAVDSCACHTIDCIDTRTFEGFLQRQRQYRRPMKESHSVKNQFGELIVLVDMLPSVEFGIFKQHLFHLSAYQAAHISLQTCAHLNCRSITRIL